MIQEYFNDRGECDECAEILRNMDLSKMKIKVELLIVWISLQPIVTFFMFELLK